MSTAEADRRTREAIDEGLDQLRHGWTAKEVVCVLMDAHLVIEDLRAEVHAPCRSCGGPKESGRGRKLCDACAVIATARRGIATPGDVCTIDGCEKPRRRRLYCEMHDKRLRTNGELGQAEPLVKRIKGNAADRLRARIEVTPNGCWEYTGCRGKNGYGRIGDDDGKTVNAHRLAWTLVNGPIPDGLHALHHCDNPPCCNVEHLFLGTDADNTADKMAKGRGRNGTGPIAATDVVVYCNFCDGPVVEPVRDDEEVSWLHSGAATYCSKACLDAHDEHRQNAAGNEAS